MSKPILIKAKEGLYQTGWVIRAGRPSEPYNYQTCLSYHCKGDVTEEKLNSLFGEAWAEAELIAASPANKDLEIVVCAVGY